MKEMAENELNGHDKYIPERKAQNQVKLRKS